MSLLLLITLLLCLGLPAAQASDKVDIKGARWDRERSELRVDVAGEGIPGGRSATLLLYSAGTNALLASFPITLKREGKFSVKLRHPIGNPADVPCRVRVVVATLSDERKVEKAPRNCDTGGAPANQAPSANAGPDQTINLGAGQASVSVTLNGSGSSDPDGSIATYNWTGNPDPANVVMPVVNLGAGTHTFTLVVTDNDGAASAPDSVTITVNAAQANQAPTANAGPDQTINLMPGQVGAIVTLNGSGSFDPDGSIAAYNWTGNPDPANVANPMLNLGAGSYTFTLVVTDDDGASSAPDSVTVTVNAPANQAPTANAGPDQTINLTAGQASADVTLNGSGSFDPDGSIATYNWTGNPDPANVAMPVVNLVPGSYLFTLVVSDDDGASSAPDTVTITVNAAPANQAPTANAGPDQTINLGFGQTLASVTLNGSGSFDPDGSIAAYTWSGTPNPADVVMPMISLGAGTYAFSLVVSDNNGATSTADTVIITVNAFSGDPHAGLTFADYQGSATCLECHENETREVHASVHYQWKGDSPHSFYRDANGQLVNLGVAGKLGGINDFCGYPDINFIGLLTDVDGNVKSGGCAGCHAGTGDMPKADPAALLADGNRTQLENVDCLMCHSDTYKRKVAQVLQADGVTRLAFVPDADAIAGGLSQPIGIRMRPSRATCVVCHSYAGGGCNSKRGDIQLAHIDPPDRNFDVHMASTAVGGAGLDCVDCHRTQNHLIAGRGVDLRPTDLDPPPQCTDCHELPPHSDTILNSHTARVDCRSCHIPHFAKPTALGSGTTDMFRDYSQPPVLSEERRLYEPFQVVQNNVMPELVFNNGSSEIYRFLDPIQPQANGKVLMAGPLGSIDDPGVKLIPVKHHMARQPHDPVTGALLPLRMGILFTGRLGGAFLPQDDIVNQAILSGAAAVPQFNHVTTRDFYDFVETERFMGISHQVVPYEMALGCNDCHGATSTRINFDALGYAPRPERNPETAANCGSGCHGDKSDKWSASELFMKLHEKHVADKRLNCSSCHNFSTASN
jgi:PKD repeat protein